MNRSLPVAVLALVLCACSSDGGDSSAYPSEAFEVWSSDLPEVEEGDFNAYAEAIDANADAWDELTPPDPIRDAHDAWIEAQRDAASVFREIEEPVSPDSEEAERVRALGERFSEWADAFAKEYGVRFFKVNGAAMEPGLSDGDGLRVPVYSGERVERGEIAVFEFHLQPDRDFIKRVIGLPGETIEVRDGMVFINGDPLDETYLLSQPNYTYGPRTVPEGHYFVLGDNRRNSSDSHAWASQCAPEQNCDFVPEENIIGIIPADAKPDKPAAD